MGKDYTLHLKEEMVSTWWVQEQEVQLSLPSFFLPGTPSSGEAFGPVWSQHREQAAQDLLP